MLEKAKKITGIIFLIYALLVATHLGEFWPFSIYPMFSQAGNPWTRSLVRDMTNDTLKSWESSPFEEVPGKTFALDDIGILQNDVANFVSKNKKWDQTKINAMRAYFDEELDNRSFLVLRVRGKLVGENRDSVVVDYTPFVYLKPDTTILHPTLER